MDTTATTHIAVYATVGSSFSPNLRMTDKMTSTSAASGGGTERASGPKTPSIHLLVCEAGESVGGAFPGTGAAGRASFADAFAEGFLLAGSDLRDGGRE